MDSSKQGNKKRAGILIALLAVAVLAAAGVFIYLHFFTYRSVKVEDYEGDVELERKGGDKDLVEGMKLVPKDVVTTGEDGLIELFIDSDKHVVAEANTCFSINAVGDENSGKVTIELEYGSTLISIDEKLAQDSEFEVETPNCLCSVRGTVFEVAYDKDSRTSEIAVTEGVVRLKSDGDVTELTAGQRAVVTDDGIRTFVFFGSYEQDGNLSNGSEPIEWEILDAGENETLLLSRYVLDAQPYGAEDTGVTWENSTLRQWLNDDFYNAAFSDTEKAGIATTTVRTADNEVCGTPGGNDTQDKVFCLSLEEIGEYYDLTTCMAGEVNGEPQAVLGNPALIGAVTPYAVDRGVYHTAITREYFDEYLERHGYREDVIGVECAYWWLRSPGTAEGSNLYMGYPGTTSWNTTIGSSAREDGGVRPAIRVTNAVLEEEGSRASDRNTADAAPGSGGDVWDEERAWADREDILPHREGDYTVFGAYEQDNDLSNGPEPIEWEVLDHNVNGTLLISRYVLDVQKDNEGDEDFTWETSSLRQWLNNDFINKAFTAAERERINSVTIQNPDSEYYYHQPGGNPTTDRIFLLGVDEILNYYSFDEWDDSAMRGSSSALVIPPTDYAKHQGVPSDEGKPGAFWWLRSPGIAGNSLCVVDNTGKTGWNSSIIATAGIRPVLYLVSDETEASGRETGGAMTANGTDHTLGPGQPGNSGNDGGNNNGHNNGNNGGHNGTDPQPAEEVPNTGSDTIRTADDILGEWSGGINVFVFNADGTFDSYEGYADEDHRLSGGTWSMNNGVFTCSDDRIRVKDGHLQYNWYDWENMIR